MSVARGEGRSARRVRLTRRISPASPGKARVFHVFAELYARATAREAERPCAAGASSGPLEG